MRDSPRPARHEMNASERNEGDLRPRPVLIKLLSAVLTAFVVVALLGTEPGTGTPFEDGNSSSVPCSGAAASTLTLKRRAGRSKQSLKAPVDSVPVSPEAIQDAVNSHGPNTSFLLSPGVYGDGPVKPKDGDRFYGEGSVVWDGGGAQREALDGSGSSNVLVSGIRFVHFKAPNQGNGIFNLNTGESAFTIEGCEIAYNGGTPVVVGNGTQVLNNSIHDNDWVGIGGYLVASVVIDRNEIYNNYLAGFSPDSATGDASGMKFGKSQNVRVTHNIIRDNHGVGIWFDTDNTGTVIDQNIITGNSYRGIMEEISYGATISNNTISGNGNVSGWIAGAGIVISTASNIEVVGNILNGNAQGIIGFQQDRGNGSQGRYRVQGNNIHDNFIVMTEGITGFTGGAEKDTTNHFYNNHYFLRSSTAFIWGNNTDVQGWQAAGQDKSGTFDCLSILPRYFIPGRAGRNEIEPLGAEVP
jgi:parallel beta-helix repeat protein